MTKTYKSFIIFFITIILILLFFLKKYNDIIKHDQIDILVSKNTELINNELSYQKKHALSLAILFSKNQNIINFLKQKEPEKLKNELNNLINLISNYTKIKNIQIQVHTKELKVFVRSWENKDSGLNLTSFRHGLVKVKKTKQPFVSNELGKRFNIKAISPIFDNKKYIGSIEVIVDYSSLKNRLKLAGIEIIPLLDDNFLDIAQYHKENAKLYNYVVIEKNYNKKLYDILLHNKNILKREKFYYEIEDKIITIISLGNIKGKSVGYLVASFEKSNQKFNYLPNYKYDGEIPNDISFKNENKIYNKQIKIR